MYGLLLKIGLMAAAVALLALQDRTLCKSEACHTALEEPLASCCTSRGCGAEGVLPEVHSAGGRESSLCACSPAQACTDVPVRVRSLTAPRGLQPLLALSVAALPPTGTQGPRPLPRSLIRWILPSPDIPRLTGNFRI